jgi:hypothetical protein
MSATRQYQCVVQVQLDPEEDSVRLQPLPIELSYFSEFSANRENQSFTQVRPFPEESEALPATPSVDCPYLAEISASRQYQSVVQVQLDPEEDPIRLQLLPIESSYLAEFSEKSDKINLLCRCGRVRKSRRRHQSLLCPYLAEISATRQYQYFAPRYGWIRRRKRHWLLPLSTTSWLWQTFSTLTHRNTTSSRYTLTLKELVMCVVHFKTQMTLQVTHNIYVRTVQCS